jgi:6-phosphogluconolactonase
MNKAYCVGYGLFLTILLMISPLSSTAAQNQFWVYIGTNTHPPSKSKGIYLYRLDVAAGTIKEMGVAAELGDPGWQKISDGGKFLYTVGTADDHRRSIVAAFGVDSKTGGLTVLNQAATNGHDSTHIDVDPGRICCVVANYNSGDISVMPINPDGTVAAPTAILKHTGSSIDPARQKHPYPHSCNVDPTGKFVLAPDLGVDKIYIYRFDAASRSLSAADPATVSITPGEGPRHLSFHPNGKFAYLVTEMGGTVVAYSWDSAKGQLHLIETVSTLPKEFLGYNKSAEVRILPNGKFLYASNRGPDDLAIFAIDQAKGTLKIAGFQPTGGKGPRDFAIDPTGNFLFAANQDSDTVTVFRVNQDTGMLSPISEATLKVPIPICVTFLGVGE